MKKLKLVLLTVMFIVMMPLSVFADGGYMFDLDNYMAYSINVDGGSAAIDGDFDFSITVRNNSKYTMSIFNLYLPFETDYGLDKIKEVKPGGSITFSGTDHVPYGVEWYKKDGEFYFDYDIGVRYTFKDLVYGEQVDYINTDNKPTAVKLTGIKDGSEYMTVEVLDENRDYAFTIREWGDADLNDRFYNRWGYVDNDVKFTNISSKTLQNFMPSVNQYMDRNSLQTLAPNQSFTDNMKYTRQISYTEDRPKATLVRYNGIFLLDGQIYGVGAERIYQNIYADNEAKISVKIEKYQGIFKSNEPGYENYLVTVKNTGKEDISNFYVMLPSEEPGFYKENYTSRLTTGNSMGVYLHQKSEMPFEVKFGVVINDTIYLIRKYTYNPENGRGKLEQLGSGYGGYETLTIAKETEEEATETTEVEAAGMPTHTPQVICVTPDPQPTPTAQVIYITEKPAIPSWVWPLLGLAIVLVGGFVLSLRQKQEKEKKQTSLND